LIYLDTGAFLARFIEKDQHHEKASEVWKRLRRRSEPCLTSNFVLDETFTLLARWAGVRFAVDRARNLYASRFLTILRPEREDEIKALALFGKYGDQAVSFTDAVSFVLMRKHRCRRAFTFDRHFDAAGFTRVP